jgi:hypothetical protein
MTGEPCTGEPSVQAQAVVIAMAQSDQKAFENGQPALAFIQRISIEVIDFYKGTKT